MSAFLTLFEREIKRFMKVLVQTVITPFISSFLYLLVFGVSLGGQVMTHGESYLAFLIPGLVMMGLMNNAFQNSSSSIVSSKFSGDLEDIRVSPVTDNQIVWALSLGALFRGVVVALITYLSGAIFYYIEKNEFLSLQHPFIFMFFIIMGGLIFGQIGICIAFWARTFDQLSAFSAFILLPLTYLGGVFLSIEHLSPFWQSISRLNPLLYLINGVRYGMLGIGDVEITHAMVISLIGLVVFYFLSRFSLRRGNFQRW